MNANLDGGSVLSMIIPVLGLRDVRSLLFVTALLFALTFVSVRGVALWLEYRDAIRPAEACSLRMRPPDALLASPTSCPDSMSQQPTILVVEDEEDLREILVEALANAGWATHQAAVGEDALDQIARLPHLDALFTDIRLPGELDGWDVAEAYRARYERGAVIYATGYSATHTPVSGSMFFRKPYKLQQLLLCLEALVPATRRPQAANPASIRCPESEG